MKWWLFALVITLIWSVGTMGAGLFHTQVHSKEVLSQPQISALWQFYLLGFGVGTVGTWIVCFMLRKKIEGPI